MTPYRPCRPWAVAQPTNWDCFEQNQLPTLPPTDDTDIGGATNSPGTLMASQLRRPRIRSWRTSSLPISPRTACAIL